jgi:Fe/S biogenesis protein NfuA
MATEAAQDIEDSAETTGSAESDNGSAPVVDGPVLTVTDEARKMVIELRSEEDDPDTLGLRLEVNGVQGVEYSYDLAFEVIADAHAEDHVQTDEGLTVMIPGESVEKLRGATLDLPSNAAQGGLVIRNPNRPDPLAGLDLELTGDLAEKVQQMLDAAVNPALAAHGGFATLVGVDDTVVYLSMGGGCQGCSMSQLTMTEGIKSQLMEAIPEITDVVDSTDHSAGSNPFYE